MRDLLRQQFKNGIAQGFVEIQALQAAQNFGNVVPTLGGKLDLGNIDFANAHFLGAGGLLISGLLTVNQV